MPAAWALKTAEQKKCRNKCLNKELWKQGDEVYENCINKCNKESGYIAKGRKRRRKSMKKSRKRKSMKKSRKRKSMKKSRKRIMKKKSTRKR